ncbi:MAG: hypothetical protein GX050_00075 [Firmicutes bacterium]|nr:hypothetical protein [Bacillota bacterium]
MDWLMLMMTVIVLGMFILAFAMRYLIHLERMALIKLGIVPPALAQPFFKRGSFRLLLAGLITALSGLGLSAGLYCGLGKGFWLIGGFIPVGVGLALIIGYMVGGDQITDRKKAAGQANINPTSGAAEHPSEAG